MLFWVILHSFISGSRYASTKINKIKVVTRARSRSTRTRGVSWEISNKNRINKIVTRDRARPAGLDPLLAPAAHLRELNARNQVRAFSHIKRTANAVVMLPMRRTNTLKRPTTAPLLCHPSRQIWLWLTRGSSFTASDYFFFYFLRWIFIFCPPCFVPGCSSTSLCNSNNSSSPRCDSSSSSSSSRCSSRGKVAGGSGEMGGCHAVWGRGEGRGGGRGRTRMTMGLLMIFRQSRWLLVGFLWGISRSF